ncbi:PEP-CTERM sorting domain-containing protein [Kaarinaea lacus]
MKTLARTIIFTCVGLAFSTTVNATVFSIDSFTIYRDGQLFFQDEFNDGIVPPSTGYTFPNGNVAQYLTIGTPGPETNGRLALDTAAGALSISDVTGAPLLVQRSRLATNNSDDPTRGLRVNHDIAVMGVYDLIAPELNNERYGIRLTDFLTGYPANDNVEITLRRNSSGALSVALREADFDNGVMNVLGETFLSDADFLNYDQIAFGLFSAADSTAVYGGFSLIGSMGSTDFRLFDAHANIFDGEIWTRAGFIAMRSATSVPEPSSIALMLLGLTGISFIRRRK